MLFEDGGFLDPDCRNRYSDLGLPAFRRIGNEMPDRLRKREPNEQSASPDLPNPFPTESNEEARAPFGRGPKAKK